MTTEQEEQEQREEQRRINAEEKEQRIVSLAKEISRLATSRNNEDDENFIKLILRDHPTCQQSVIRLFLKTIEAMANKEYVDGRNEDSRLVCEQIIKGFRLARGGYDLKRYGHTTNDQGLPSQYLPYI